MVHKKEKDGRILSPRERALATPVDIIFRTKDDRGKPRLYETKVDKRVKLYILLEVLLLNLYVIGFVPASAYSDLGPNAYAW